jgi:uncharacterized phage protein gp47/JayE
MASGLTADGLEIEAVEDIRTALETETRAAFGASLPLGDKTALGHLIGIVAEQTGLAYERLEQVNSAQDPDTATGPALDARCVLTGTFRQPAIPSTVTLTLCGAPTTTVPSGSTVATASTAVLFDTQDTVTITALSAWNISSIYFLDDRATNAGRCYVCISPGTSAGSGGPTTTDADITDGSVHWEYLGEGTGAIDVTATSQDTGEIQATAFDLTVIKTPIFGWSSSRNLVDATLGATESTDEELRLLRVLELAGSGSTTKDAIRSDLLKLTGVTSATIFVNNTNTTTDGLPPHSFESLIRGGDTQDIVDSIASNQAAGVSTHGTSSGTFTDSEGNTDTIYFSRPDEQLLYADISVNYDASLYPTDGDTEIVTAITTWGADLATGRDADPSAVAAQAFSVTGVLGVTRVLLSTDVIGTPGTWATTTAYVNTIGAPSVVTNDGGRVYTCITSGTSGATGPTGVGSDITDGTAHWKYIGAIVNITSRQLAVFDSARTTIRSTAVTP